MGVGRWWGGGATLIGIGAVGFWEHDRRPNCFEKRKIFSFFLVLNDRILQYICSIWKFRSSARFVKCITYFDFLHTLQYT